MTTAPMASPITKLAIEVRYDSRALWQDALTHIRRDKLTLVAIFMLLLMTLLSIGGTFYVENVLELDPNDTNVTDRFMKPDLSRLFSPTEEGERDHILGTDQLGRDQFLRLLFGGRVSLLIAYSSSIMIILIGVTLGLVAGFFGGYIDDFISWVINTLSSIPPLFLLLIASAIWEPSVTVLIVILALLGWVGTSRLVRAEVLSIKERDYVIAARALGSSNVHIMFVHILPNLISIVIVTMTIIAGNLILVESGLSFLGVGVRPPTPTWGNMLTDSRSYFVTGTHLVVVPGILIMITVLCFYLVGDGLRDALDPRSTRK